MVSSLCCHRLAPVVERAAAHVGQRRGEGGGGGLWGWWLVVVTGGGLETSTSGQCRAAGDMAWHWYTSADISRQLTYIRGAYPKKLNTRLFLLSPKSCQQRFFNGVRINKPWTLLSVLKLNLITWQDVILAMYVGCLCICVFVCLCMCLNCLSGITMFFVKATTEAIIIYWLDFSTVVKVIISSATLSHDVSRFFQ